MANEQKRSERDRADRTPVKDDDTKRAGEREKDENLDTVDEASDESFPASDPPSYTPNTGVGRKSGTD